MSVPQLTERLSRELKWNNVDVDPTVLAKSMKDAGIGERLPDSATRPNDGVSSPQIRVEKPITIASPIMNPFLTAVNDNDSSKAGPVDTRQITDYARESTQKTSVQSLSNVANELHNVVAAVNHVDMDIAKENTQKRMVDGVMQLLDTSRESTANLLRLADISERELERLKEELVAVHRNTNSLIPIESYEENMTMEFANLHNVLRDGYQDLSAVLMNLTNAIEMMVRPQPIEFPSGQDGERFFTPMGELFDKFWKELKDQTLSPFAKMSDQINSKDAFVGPRRWDDATGQWTRDKLQQFDYNRLTRDSQPIISGIASVLNVVRKYSLWWISAAAAAASVEAGVNPERLQEYMGAFRRIWEINVIPTFQYLKEGAQRIYENAIVPLATKLQEIGQELIDWWNGPGENAVLTVGRFVNDTLIYVIGTALPASLALVGTALRNVSELAASLIDNITTIISGIREMDLTKIFSGLEGIGAAIRNFALATIDSLATAIVRLLGMEDNLGMKNNETVGEYLVRSMGEITSAIGNWFVKLKDGIVEFITTIDPVQMVVDAVKSMFNAIVDMIPTYDDIAKHINSVIDTWTAIPETLRDSMKLARKIEGFDMEGYQALRQRDDQIKPVMTSKRIEEQYKASLPSIFQVNDNRVIDASTNVTGGTTNSNSGRTHVVPSTRPEESLYDKALLRPPGFWGGGNR